MLKNRILTLSFVLLFTSNHFGQDLCPPSAVSAFGGELENVISWAEPVGALGCGDFEIGTLPFTHQTSNAGMGDDWLVSGTQGEDVAYTLNVGATATYTFNLCSDFTDYDTKLEIFTNDGDCIMPVSTGHYNDDGPSGTCEESPAPYTPSLLESVTLQAGQYYVIVDGYSGATGNYEISVTVSGRNENFVSNTIKDVWPIEQQKMADLGISQEEINSITDQVLMSHRFPAQSTENREIPADCGTFSTYRVYNATDNSMVGETTNLTFTHSNLTNGTEYCYYVKTVYTEGESVASDSVCATPAPFTPAPATNLSAEVWDEEVFLYWTSPDVMSLGVPYIETFDEGGLIDLWLIDGDNWVYDDFAGNPTPSMKFSWFPTATDYDQSLYAPSIPLGTLTDVTVSFDFAFDNYDTTGLEFLSIEYQTGTDTTWHQLELFDNSGEDFDFTNFTYNVTGLSDHIYVRFHCYGATTFDLNDYGIDNFSVTSNGRTSRNEYDFLGYNVYVDGVLDNVAIFDSTDYTVYSLNNELSYLFAVAAIYEGGDGEANYESDLITITAQPIYVFGDITGVVTDPNGATLDSVVVLSGSVSDTTSSDGVYTLWNLETGNQTVTFQRAGFYTEMVDTSVLAQADPTILDYVLSPDMPSPVGLSASPNDHSIDLSWKTPGNGEEMFFQYDDGVLENAFYFYTSYEEGTAHGMRFDVGGGFDLMAASVKILSEGDNYWPWPDETHGPIRVLVFDDNNGVPGNLLHDEETVAENGWATIYPNVGGLNGSVYIIASHAGDWSVEGDPEGFGVDGAVDYPDNMYNYQDGVWTTGDGLGYGGDYMMAVQVMSYGGARTISYASLDNELNIDFVHGASTVDLTHMSSMQNPSPSSPVFNSTFASNFNREDQLVEYKVYEVGESDATLVATTTDTFATITVAANYVEYCFAVKAVWNTDDYGTIESDASNTSCTVPFTSGDADFDSDVDVSDLLSVVDFILEETTPSDDQFRNCDINMDDEINISDVVMMVDIMFSGTAARIADYDPSVMAYVDLIGDISDGKLWLNVDYDQMMRGVQFELTYDPNLIAVHSPQLTMIQDNIMMTSSEKKDGIISILIANLSGGGINKDGDELLYFPIEFLGNKVEVANIKLDNIGIADAKGDLAPTVARGASADFKILPGKYALHQNFPNPFNPVTEIQFDLPEDSRVELAIYNLMGQKINTLISGDMTPGFHTFKWNGKDYSGQAVSSGMYFYSLSSKGFKSTRKMLLLK